MGGLAQVLGPALVFPSGSDILLDNGQRAVSSVTLIDFSVASLSTHPPTRALTLATELSVYIYYKMEISLTIAITHQREYIDADPHRLCNACHTPVPGVRGLCGQDVRNATALLLHAHVPILAYCYRVSRNVIFFPSTTPVLI